MDSEVFADETDVEEMDVPFGSCEQCQEESTFWSLLGLDLGDQSVVPYDDYLNIAIREEIAVHLNRELLVDLLRGSTGSVDIRSSFAIHLDFIKRALLYEKDSYGAKLLLNTLRRGSFRRGEINCQHRKRQDLAKDIVYGAAVGIMKCRSNSEEFDRIDACELVEMLNQNVIVSTTIHQIRFRLIEKTTEFFWFYFHIPTLDDVYEMQNYLKDDSMKILIEEYFHELLKCEQRKINLELEWQHSDYERCIRCFYNMVSREICGLPTELLDLILNKVVLTQMCLGEKTNHKSDQSIFIGLASVSGLWSMTIITRKFKSSLTRLLADYFRKAKKRSTIIRQNHEFLKEILEPDCLMDHLQSTGCLTHEKVSSLKRMTRIWEKNDELLLQMQKFNWQNYFKVLQCLCTTNQVNAATILEYGGETIKIHVSSRDILQKAALEMCLVEKIQQSQNKDCKSNKCLSEKHGLGDCSIIHAKHDRGIGMWLWFKTEDAWNRMKTISQETLVEAMDELYHRLMPNTSLMPHRVQMCNANFDNTFGKRKIVFETKHSLQLDGEAKFVTSLMDTIYVSQRSSILVFKNKVPYPQLLVIRFPNDQRIDSSPIGTCHMHNCLYARGQRCIYKIEPMINHRLTPWLNEDEENASLSVVVSCTGDVLVLDKIVKPASLRVFTFDGVLRHKVSVNNFEYGVLMFFQEILPSTVALICGKIINPKCDFLSGIILVMRLDEGGTILRQITWEKMITSLVPFSFSRLLIGDNSTQYLSVYDYHLNSIQIPNHLSKNMYPIDLYFSANQKQLFVLNNDFEGNCKIDVYKMNYEDEDYD